MYINIYIYSNKYAPIALHLRHVHFIMLTCLCLSWLMLYTVSMSYLYLFFSLIPKMAQNSIKDKFLEGRALPDIWTCCPYLKLNCCEFLFLLQVVSCVVFVHRCIMLVPHVLSMHHPWLSCCFVIFWFFWLKFQLHFNYGAQSFWHVVHFLQLLLEIVCQLFRISFLGKKGCSCEYHLFQ